MRPPRLITALLGRLLPETERDAMLGDLERIAGFDAVEIERQVLAQLSDPDSRDGGATLTHDAHGSTTAG